jgi:uncharacterized damage-inducible protein DinB
MERENKTFSNFLKHSVVIPDINIFIMQTLQIDQRQTFIQMSLKAWNIHVNRIDKFLEGLSDEALLYEIAPGKNRIVYLLGHLIASNDTMISLFGLGERKYAHLDEAFLKNPDRSTLAMPEPAELRKLWKESNAILTAHFSKMLPDDWFSRHTAMTDEDFEKEPGRNKLSVLINRTNHMAYHLGQLALVK